MSMQLIVRTLAKEIFAGRVHSVSFPGVQGNFTVLKNHALMVSALEAGDIVYKDELGRHSIPVEGGVARVIGDNKIEVLL